jgi:HEAT repeat protein/beta-lactamase regulating signal transducer with metallopeptidase domain
MTVNDLPVSWLPLADAVVKATVILLTAALASVILRHASAALRHLVWTLALCSALLLPVMSFALPKWQMALFTIAQTPAPAAEPAPMPVAALPAPGEIHAPRLGRADATPSNGATASNSATTSTSAGRTILPDLSWHAALAGVWMLGALAILGRIVAGLIAVRFLSRRTQLITDAPWLPMAMDIADEMGVSSRLRFLRSGRASMPVAAGIFTPSVIMPADADSWSESRLRVVLLHELAHVKRRDCLTHILAQAACAFYWFNPLAWLAVKRARAERERACDDLVLACGTRGSEYADQLLEMARVLRGDRFPALLGGASLAMAHRSQLEGRLIAILDPRVPRSALTRGRTIAAAALACCAVAPLGALQPWTAEVHPAALVAHAAVVAPGTERPSPNQPPASEPKVTRDAVSQPRPAPASPEVKPPAQRTFENVPDSHWAAMPEPHPLPHPMPVVADRIAEAAVAAVATAAEWAINGEEQEPKVAGAAERGGSKADPRMIAALTAALKDTDKEVRETAMHALVQMKDPAVFEPLLQALKDSSPDVREQAAHGLGQFRDRRAVQPLIGALKDENASVREQAAYALGQLRDPASVDALGAAVRDNNPSVREQAVHALSQIRDPKSVEPLISALKDSNADVREQAAHALGQIRDPRAIDALVVAVRDADADVREQAVYALGQIRDPRAIDALTIALKDQNAEVRRQAAYALGQLAR